MRQSQALFSLWTLPSQFPITFTRIIRSSLSHNREYEPDIEDEEGELFWPGAPSTGKGLGWACLVSCEQNHDKRILAETSDIWATMALSWNPS